MIISDLKHGLFKYEVKDYYAILGVPIDASAKDIRLRYLKIAYQLHPDTNRAQTQEEKQRASDILSKVVNAAYENLYKEKLRKECQLIMSEIGRRLATDAYKITIGSENAKKLLQEEKNTEKTYHEMIEKFASEQYQDLSKLSTKIALMSELNMVYLMSQKGKEMSKIMGVSSQPKIVASEPIIIESTGNITTSGVNIDNPVENETAKKPTVSRLDKLISSAKQHAEDENYEQGIMDLREAVKIDSNSSTVHGLLGSMYLKQNNLIYGRIHINKAMMLNGNDPIAKQAQQELKNIEKEKKAKSGGASSVKSTTKDSKIPKSSEKSKDKDGKGKKEAPKIFGIPLW
ncbi:MAG: DnaJ domain-containing protein [Cyanobacteria bacterium]|nr:DnaJ domain-containing protein [Cyanobacteria bacterium CG_2015-16_32_12]NCO79079.1 DnaJ domain-containing protein [Cyanobacteria bacterium CG_2015-22_32_23]NCQ04713.1 DnaJ domain-containing protein [Cyanobacteria bacterium CG_2015-09_32_10]NCQ42600.1 DnaJ domain-containing protein [Cyanobacteria bacterium CG_2015-04_32_10]NCS85823.1 DnaJ domain-containing protein [Cyanobacteria bacterium CG_2015-02_32_10]